MVTQKPKEDIGIIVGRFQVHNLHEAHLELISYVKSNHNNIVIILGLSPIKCTLNNPLDFAARRTMLQEHGIQDVLYIDDHPSDETWSKNLDNLIHQHYPTASCRLYGSRDSFIKYYSGKLPTEELVQTTFTSGTEERKKIAVKHTKNADFRAGVISATFDRFPVSYQTVDMLVYNRGNQSILLGKKNKTDGHMYRLFGGFIETTDKSLEDAAKRELAEEAGINLNVSEPIYIGSKRINDWRYRNEQDKVMTALFGFEYLWGTPKPGSDIDEIAWIKASDLEKYLAPFHMELITQYIDVIQKKLFTA